MTTCRNTRSRSATARPLVVAAIAALTLAQAPPAAPSETEGLRTIVASGRLTELRWPDFSDYQAHVTAFYEASGWTPAWVQSGASSVHFSEDIYGHDAELSRSLARGYPYPSPSPNPNP